MSRFSRNQLNHFQCRIVDIVGDCIGENHDKEIVFVEPTPQYSDDPKDFVWVKLFGKYLEIWAYRDGVDITMLDPKNPPNKELETFTFESLDYRTSEELIADFSKKIEFLQNGKIGIGNVS